MVTHLIENVDDVDSHRAEGDAAPAAGALVLPVVLDKVLELVEDPLAKP